MPQPGSFGAQMPKDEAWLVRKVQELEEEVKHLAAAQTLNAATISSGGLQIDAEGGVTVRDQTTNARVFYIGYTPMLDGSGRQQMVVYGWRGNDGTPAFALGDQGTVPGHTYSAAFTIYDRAGNVVSADDTNTGVGIANPYIPVGVFADITGPTNTTTSATFAAMQWADSYQQHPKVTASVLVQSSAATTGEVRLTIGGTQIGSTLSIGAAAFGQFTILPALWPSGTFSFGQRTVVQLEARRLTGTGTIGVRGLGLWGVQS